ncbi:hypothetical protein [Streptomyces sp. NBC_01751]|uniref:hypothetical protein n=1 Tax=Streptomyces sp. NBC_01751 TaxID=2975929 RepID=UPI002DD7CA6D|nr:hypothetical protein [Streptomyces sp. NBC_01751]WSD23370.1 hypothetical protein OHA26_07700 [Streptomyces sp. NBC_01751]
MGKKIRRTPEGLAEAAQAAGYRVEFRTHGWLIFTNNPERPTEMLGRNISGGRGQKNNEAIAKRLGIL